MTEDTDVHIEASQCCEMVIRGSDEFAVLDALARWGRKHEHDGIEIIGLQWRRQWVPDPTPSVQGDEIREYLVTMQFKTGAQLELNWDD